MTDTVSENISSDSDYDSYLSDSELVQPREKANPHCIYAEACALYKCFPVACVVDDIIERQWLDVNNRGLSENDVLEIINRNTVSGLSAKLQLVEYKKI